MIAPVVFFDFLVSMEDNYHSFWVSNFLRSLRYIGLIICILLPGLYVAVATYSPEILRVELALTIAGSRVGVPYPPFIEVIFMLFFMELLVEASIRLPKAMSATATTVGGLILGTAATEASLTSNIMIIIISAVAISTFVIPINEMSFAIRAVRFLIIIFSTIFGLAGLTLATIGFLMYLVNLSSFGEPYLRLYNFRKKDERGDLSK
ncbi:Spore germination protein OS=Ureibacillus acetophenoni OX=614649 GN=SAMN05877842_1193 PE=3 SV=1 [Ureibacillus acetophenoni]